MKNTRANTRVTRSMRAGLTLPMTYVKNEPKKKTSPKKKNMRVSRGAAAYTTGVLGYLTAKAAVPKSVGTTSLGERVLRCGVKLSVVAGDIAQISCDAVVIPSSANFSIGGQVASHINRISKGELQTAINTAPRPSIATGGAASLKCNQMNGCSFDSAIFCNGPSWGDAVAAIALLEETTRNCLICAQISGVKTIAFPAIGSGVGNFPKQTAVETILRAMSGYLNSEKHDLTDVTFVLHDQQSIQVYVTELGRLQE